MKVDATLSNMTSAFPQLLGHTGTLGDTDNFRHHHGRVAPLRTPGHQTWSSISNCLVSPHIARAPKHWHRISQIQRALNIECPGPVSHFSL